eukprot:758080-Hanusia_phi.AAC.7
MQTELRSSSHVAELCYKDYDAARAILQQGACHSCARVSIERWRGKERRVIQNLSKFSLRAFPRGKASPDHREPGNSSDKPGLNEACRGADEDSDERRQGGGWGRRKRHRLSGAERTPGGMWKIAPESRSEKERWGSSRSAAGAQSRGLQARAHRSLARA